MAFQFNDEMKKQFEWLKQRYPTRQAVLLPALRLVEAQQGFVDEPSMEYVARELDLAPAFVNGVFTFYSHYRRKSDGEHVVWVCHTLPCALRGACKILEAFQEHLKLGVGETSADGKFTLKKAECLGSCTTHPVAQINEDYFENLTPEKVRDIVLALKNGEKPPHLSNGPSLEGGMKHWGPLADAYPEGK
ncbi:MAG: NAD(P)H-dependent oxidoreductase subunit E [Planctomycetota bacterium]|nr:NAD(P)H-dependent oxidoreductase subunit E [Planctomycetota bacterium]